MLRINMWLFTSFYLLATVFASDLLMIDTLKAEEYVQAQAAGYTVDVVTKDTFNAMTTAQFAAYKAIVIGDPYCADIPNIAFLDTNRDIWSSAITGNIILLGTDPSFHALYGRTVGARNLMTNSIGFAAGLSNQTGLYIAMSCYGAQTPVTSLSYFGVFSMADSMGCDDMHIVASSPALGTLGDSDISGWGCSIHETFTSYPSIGSNPFLPLAISKEDTGLGAMTFADGSYGVPYILARGASPAGCGDGKWQSKLGEECDSGTTNGETGDECSTACRCLSGRPDGNGHCFPPLSSSTSTSSTSTTSATSTTSSASITSSTSSSTTESSTTSSMNSTTSTMITPTFPTVIYSNSTSSSSAETQSSSSFSSSTVLLTSSSSSSAASSFTAPTVVVATSTSATAASVTSTTSSSPTVLPSSFIIAMQFTTEALLEKRQTRTSSVAVLNSGGMLTLTTDCVAANLFSIDGAGRMGTGSLIARAMPSAIMAGSELFTFAAPATGQVQTTFTTNNNGFVSWSNQAFKNGDAAFAVNPSTGMVEVFYSGAPPANYRVLRFRQFAGNTLTEACNTMQTILAAEAAAAQATSTSSISGTASSSIRNSATPSLTSSGTTTFPNDVVGSNIGTGMVYPVKPVGLEVVTFVTITTLFVNGQELRITTGTATSTNFIFASAVPGSPCYACLLASQNIACPLNEHEKFVVYTSTCTGLAASAYTAPSAVYVPCPTCSTTTLSGAAMTPGAASSTGLSSLAFVPATTVVIGGVSVVQGSATSAGQIVSTAVVINNVQSATTVRAQVATTAAVLQSSQEQSIVTGAGAAQATLSTSTLSANGIAAGSGASLPSSSIIPSITLFTGGASSVMPGSGIFLSVCLGAIVVGLARFL